MTRTFYINKTKVNEYGRPEIRKYSRETFEEISTKLSIKDLKRKCFCCKGRWETLVVDDTDNDETTETPIYYCNKEKCKIAFYFYSNAVFK